MQQINLIDPRLLPPQRLLSGQRIASLALAGLLLVCGHWGIERAALARAMAASAPEPTVGAPAADSERALDELRERVAKREALRDLLASDRLPPDPAALLRALFDALPPTIWLTEVEVARERSVRIAGGALEVGALDPFAARLASIAALRGIPIHTLRLEPAAEGAGLRSWHFVLASKPASEATP